MATHAGIKSISNLMSHHLPFLSQTVAVILLSFVLAVGFLMIILSCALWSNWLPLLVGAWSMACMHVWCLMAVLISPHIRSCAVAERDILPLRRRRLHDRLRRLRTNRPRTLYHCYGGHHRVCAPPCPHTLGDYQARSVRNVDYWWIVRPRSV